MGVKHRASAAAPPQPAAVATAPFIPGVMIDWEVMTGHSQTRWHWGDHEGAIEPPMPWCG